MSDDSVDCPKCGDPIILELFPTRSCFNLTKEGLVQMPRCHHHCTYRLRCEKGCPLNVDELSEVAQYWVNQELMTAGCVV